MRAVIQRVSRASVSVQGKEVSQIGRGLLILLGVGKGDTEKDAVWIADKISRLRIFPDNDGKMDKSVMDVGGKVLLVSQFTLMGDARKGRRPSFDGAMDPEPARHLCEQVFQRLTLTGLKVGQGVFGAMMDVALVNDGPVTILLEGPKRSMS